MPSGKTHNKINFFLWFLSLIFFLKYQYLIAPYFRVGIWDTYFIGWSLSGVWFCLFSLDMYFHTVYLNPDVDCKSDGRKKLWIFGWILDMIFPHRGPTHNILIWSAGFTLFGYFIGTWFIGGWLAILGHLVSDWIGTGIKKITPKWIRKSIRKVF